MSIIDSYVSIILQDKYSILCQKIEDASKTSVPSEVLPEMNKNNHFAIVKVFIF